MKENLTIKDVTPDVKYAVRGFLTARHKAVAMRAKVDMHARDLMREEAFYNDLEVEHGMERQRIFDPARIYLYQDEALMQRYYAGLDARLRCNGLKPDDMDFDHCPALVLEHEQLKAEWALLSAAAEMLGLEMDGREFNNALLCQRDGLEKRREFIELTVKMVVGLEEG